MKPPLLALLCLVCTIALRAQSTLDWANRIPGTLVAPVYGPDPASPTEMRRGNTPSGLPGGTQSYVGTLLAGAGFSAQLYFGPAGTPENSLVPVAPAATFGTGGNAGFYEANPVILGIGPVFTAQLRVWDNQNGVAATWESALTDPSAARGTSELLTIDLASFAPGQTPHLRGLESFQLYMVPEPSLFAIGLLSVTVQAIRWRQRSRAD